MKRVLAKNMTMYDFINSNLDSNERSVAENPISGTSKEATSVMNIEVPVNTEASDSEIEVESPRAA